MYADLEFKQILIDSNFNTCREPRNTGTSALHDGYRIDLIYNVQNARGRADNMKRDYESLGYKNCAVLSPDAVMAIDPFLADFCKNHAQADKAGVLQWHNDSVALWRPGGCFDSQVFLPKCYEYLKKVMGTYINENGQTKNCFTLHFDRNVQELVLKNDLNKLMISGVNFANGNSKHSKKVYKNSTSIFCPGEAVGTLKNLGLKEPAYAGFAGATLMLNIPIPDDKIERYSAFNHCMEVYTQDTAAALAWQARFRDGKIFIGVGGTKAFYGDQRPEKDQAFAKNRNLLH